MTRIDLLRFLAVCAGGAFGTGLRFLANIFVPRFAGDAFPWQTLGVNVIGSFLLAMIAVAGTRKVLTDDWRLILGTGVMGGLTTYSTFNLETMHYVEEGRVAFAALYSLSTFAGCLAAGLAGFEAARLIPS